MRKTRLFSVLSVLTVVVLSFALAGCGDADTESTSSSETVSESAAVDDSDSTSDDAAESDTSDDAASDTDDSTATDADVVLPAGFPSGMPIPDGTVEVRVSPAFDEGYNAYVPARNYTDVIVELETALPAAGWEIMERTSGYAVQDDVLFLVTSGGLDMYVAVEPQSGDDTDTLVTYYVPQ